MMMMMIIIIEIHGGMILTGYVSKFVVSASRKWLRQFKCQILGDLTDVRIRVADGQTKQGY
jgi:hypothetical protein